jgi:predicted nucleotidyltransferase component of viral defense system
MGRLLKISHAEGEDYQLVLTRYAIERLLYRLSVSNHSKSFVLKGAMLLSVWIKARYRTTRDLDLLGYGENSEPRLTKVFRDICGEKVEPDGLEFDQDSIRVGEIREDQEYQGQRIKLDARLGKARIKVQVDVGFGDVVKPRIQEIDFPVILKGFPVPRIRAYPREAVVAEKVETLVRKGLVNSRMKDFYDLLAMAQQYGFDGSALKAAVKATFERRKTKMPEGVPPALSSDFVGDRIKQRQWKAFLTRSKHGEGATELTEVVGSLRAFVVPLLNAIAEDKPLKGHWLDGAWRFE